MSFLTQMLAASNPTSFDAALQAAGFDLAPATTAGVSVGPESALKLSAAYACDRLICETVASLPALVFERLSDGGRKRATNHPLYDVLHRQPNDYQTAIEFFDYMTHCAVMRGNAFARIIPGARGFADQLRPLPPDYVQMEPVGGRGALRYRVSLPGQAPFVLADEEVLHVKGMSADGVTGVSVITYARESLGLALGAERFGGRFFRNNARPGGVLESVKPLSSEAGKKLKASWENAHSGDNQHRVAVLEDGVTFKEVGINNKDSQFLETREFQAEDICRWFRVPPHMVGLTSKVTSWGSGIEQLGQGFITYTLMPWLIRWQQAISRDLILAPNKYFVEFATEALLRGDLKARYDAYALALDKGFMSPNEVRERENMNPFDGGDAYRVSSGTLDLNAIEPGPEVTAETEAEPMLSSHYVSLVNLAAGRVVRKEVAALARIAKRGAVGVEWAEAVSAFYSDHAEFVMQALGISPALASHYVSAAAASVTAAGAAGLQDAEFRRVSELAALVLDSNVGAAPVKRAGEYSGGPMVTVNLPPVSVYPEFHMEQQLTPPAVNVSVNPTPVTVENHITAAEQLAPVVNVSVNPTPVKIENNVAAAEAPQVVVNTPRLSRQHTTVKRKGDEMTGTDSTFEYED